MCEDCQEKWAESWYGLQVDRKRRWCGTCAKWHRGVYLPKRKMCENCQEKQPSALWPEGLGQHFSEIRPRHARPEMGMRMLTHATLVYTGILGTKVQKNEGRC